MPIEKQIMIIFAGTNGFLDQVPTERAKDWEVAFHKFIDTQHPEIGEEIRREKKMSEDVIKRLRGACEEFAKGWS